MKCFNVYDVDTKVLLTNVLLHDTASRDDVARAACAKLNKIGYTVPNIEYRQAEAFLLIEES